MKKKPFLIIIPARSGSTRIKNKNLKKIRGKSLLDIKIKSCKKIKQARIVVSTDSKKIRNFALRAGAVVPYLRPKKYSSSKSSTLASVLDMIRFLKRKEKYIPEYIGILPPTNPFLKTESILKAYTKLKKHKKINSIVGFSKSTDHPFSFILGFKNKIKFNIIKYRNKIYSDYERTQDWPNSYVGSASLKIVRFKFLNQFLKNHSPVINQKTFDISNSIGIELSQIENFDINTEYDLNLAQSLKNFKNR